ncbi:MAG: transposase [Rhodoferax sp.]|nr:transposase [Rhodoferax sp.]
MVQRGVHGQVICADEQDYLALLDALYLSARQYRVALHGYVVVSDHFHVLLTPADAIGLSRMMQAMSRSYVPYFNRKYLRRGTLWGGRFRSSVLQADYAIDLLHYFDSHPQRTGDGPGPSEYAWSSYAHYSGAKPSAQLSTLAQYWALGNTPFAREAAYRAQSHTGIDVRQVRQLSDAVNQGWALGDAGFLDQLQRASIRRITPKAPGRPKKAPTRP